MSKFTKIALTSSGEMRTVKIHRAAPHLGEFRPIGRKGPHKFVHPHTFWQVIFSGSGHFPASLYIAIAIALYYAHARAWYFVYT